MKKQILFGVFILSTLRAIADVDYTYSGSAYTIPDGNDSGVYSTITVSGANISLSDINITLNVSGGYNGDLYAYLSYDGIRVDLLNRVGTGTGTVGSPQYNDGYSTSGFSNVTLDDQGSGGNIHNVQNPSSLVSYKPDAQNGSSLASFNGINPNGVWTLFFADESGGGGTSTVQGWSLDIDSVPEPGTWGAISGAGLLGLCGVRAWRQRRQQNAAV
jgi:subtilisin-like proprotein convertase family protein